MLNSFNCAVRLLSIFVTLIALPANAAPTNTDNLPETIPELLNVSLNSPLFPSDAQIAPSKVSPLFFTEKLDKTDGLDKKLSVPPSPDPTHEKLNLDDVPNTIIVKGFIFESADKENKKLVFSEKELQDVIKKALNLKNLPEKSEKLTFAQLLQARSSITQHYIDKGYITSGAFISVDNRFEVIKENFVKISIFEGRLGRVELLKRLYSYNDQYEHYEWLAVVDGLPKSPILRVGHTRAVPGNGMKGFREVLLIDEPSEKPSEKYLTPDLLTEDEENFAACLVRQLSNTEPLNQAKLLDTLRLVQDFYPDVKFGIELLPGKEAGRSKLRVKVDQANQDSKETLWNLGLATDNNQSPGVGSWGQQIQASRFTSDPWKSDDLFSSISFTRTEGSTAFDGSILSRRRNEMCNRLVINANAGIKNSKIISRPFNELDIQSKSIYFDASIKWTEQLRLDSGLTRGAGLFYEGSDASILGIPFPISFGANSDGRTRVAGLRGYIETYRRSRFGALALRGDLSLGGSFSTRPDNDRFFRPFIVLRGQGQWARLLTPDVVFVANANLQLAGTSLPALEQLSLGGQDTIRGYRKNFLLTDNGFLASMELQLTVAKIQDWRIKLIPFMDFGSGWNNSGSFDVPSPSTLWSTGIGFLVQNNDRFSARVDWGIPLIETDLNGNTLQERGIYFSVSGVIKF